LAEGEELGEDHVLAAERTEGQGVAVLVHERDGRFGEGLVDGAPNDADGGRGFDGPPATRSPPMMPATATTEARPDPEPSGDGMT
jgi:hypothetical protein